MTFACPRRVSQRGPCGCTKPVLFTKATFMRGDRGTSGSSARDPEGTERRSKNLPTGGDLEGALYFVQGRLIYNLKATNI